MPRTGRKKNKGGEKSHPEKVERTSAKLDHVVVSSDSAPPSTFKVPQIGPKQKKMLAGLALVLVVAGGIALYAANREPKKAVVYGCSTEINQKASAKLDGSKVNELEPIVNEIKQLPRYEQDVNCQYILLTYYINIGDAAAATETLAKLKQIYDPAKGYDSRLTRRSDQSPEALQPTVDFLNQRSAKYEKGVKPL